MQTAVKKIGNSLAICIPNTIAKNLSLSDNTKLDVKMQKAKIILTKKEKLTELCKKINDKNLNIDEPYQARGKEW